ncbi:MAG: hypothetical protein RM338_03705 [Nostoc sp. DedQUE12a]|nr:hypothetical protein [Nostoc sp. DedQUE12a]
MLDITVSQEVLNFSGAVTLIRQIITASIAHHVIVNFDSDRSHEEED